MFNTNHTNLSKESIANRMFRNAARAWGLNDTNMDNFDPLVRLLVEACAVEVYRIDNEIAALQGTMTERLARLLIPEAHTQPRPAHAIIHATSSDNYMYVSLESQFSNQKRVASIANGPLDSSLDVFFSPAGRFKTVAGDVAYIAAAGNLYSLSSRQQKETFLRTMPGKALPAQTAWVGIDLSHVSDLTDISFFIDLNITPDKERYLSTLKHVTCSLSGQPIKLNAGLSNTSFEDHQLSFEDALDELYINRRLEKMLHRLYCNHFITIDADNLALTELKPSAMSLYPPEFAQYFNAAELSAFKKPLLWLQLIFPPHFNAAVLDDIMIAINCFPVANRHLNEITYRLNSYFNIIPLLTNEQFFAVRQVEGTQMNSAGRTDYVYYPFDRYGKADKGIYTVRTGDLERFDSRNAAEYLNFLVELLRDESRAFAAFGQDFMATAIKELNQNINLIDQKIKQNLSLLHTSPSYLLINPLEEGDTIFVQFWSSNGADANGIRGGSNMELYGGSAFRKESLVLMTPTTGGMNKLENTEVLTAFKSVLLSRGRIVTAADVKNFCLAHLQGKATDVKVRRGIAQSSQPNQGLVPVVDVEITPDEERQVSAEEWKNIKAEMLTELANQSAVDVNYNIRLITN